MAGKRQRRRGDTDGDGAYFLAPQKVFPSPFQNLKRLYKTSSLSRGHDGASSPSTATAKPTPPREAHCEPEELFRQAMVDVRPLEDRGDHRQPRRPAVCRTAEVNEDAQVLAALCELVSGGAAFDVTQTEEYVEGRRAGLDRRILNKLRRGEFAIQAHIDLHGMTRATAKQALSEFVARSVRDGRQSVLVVSGRGLRSPGKEPVLKHALAYWLSHGQLSAHVLAFVSARPTDGGVGAMYVLLRRERRRARFEVMGPVKRIS